MGGDKGRFSAALLNLSAPQGQQRPAARGSASAKNRSPSGPAGSLSAAGAAASRRSRFCISEKPFPRRTCRISQRRRDGSSPPHIHKPPLNFRYTSVRIFKTAAAASRISPVFRFFSSCLRSFAKTACCRSRCCGVKSFLKVGVPRFFIPARFPLRIHSRTGTPFSVRYRFKFPISTSPK